MPDTKESSKAASNSSNTVLKTVAGVAIGAAIALGAYFMGKEEGQSEAKQSYQERVSYGEGMNDSVRKILTKREDDDGDEKISKDCDICRVSFKQLLDKGIELHSTPCGHVFCKSCIDASLRIYSRCPVCNEELTPGQTHRIFL